MFSKNDKLLFENVNLEFELNGYCKIHKKQEDFVDQISGTKPIHLKLNNSKIKPKNVF